MGLTPKPVWSLTIGDMRWRCIRQPRLFVVQTCAPFGSWVSAGIMGASPRELLDLVTQGKLTRAKLEGLRR